MPLAGVGGEHLPAGRQSFYTKVTKTWFNRYASPYVPIPLTLPQHNDLDLGKRRLSYDFYSPFLLFSDACGWQAAGSERQQAVERAEQLTARGLEIFTAGDAHQAERIQQLALAVLGRAGVTGLALAMVLSGLADVVFQADKHRLPEAVDHLRRAAQVRTPPARNLM